MTLARPWLLGLCCLALCGPAQASEPDLLKDTPFPPALRKKSPASVAELRALQSRVQQVVKKVTPAVVGIHIGGASGSGVIVSADGIVLTAGHVSGEANKDCTLIFPDGKTVKGKTLGANKGIDSGMIKITEKGGPWPYVDLGDSKGLAKGQWVVSIGHPNGVQPGRTPVVRLGRVLNTSDSLIQTDCTLVGGDSGGPLFDLDGKVIGIHSRIGLLITANIHVPVDTYRVTWDRLTAGEVWGGRPGSRTSAKAPNLLALGLTVRGTPEGCVILRVHPETPAAGCGLREGDRIVSVDGTSVENADELREALQKKFPGGVARLEIDRDDLKMKLRLTLPKDKE
jgi:serine protease Do